MIENTEILAFDGHIFYLDKKYVPKFRSKDDKFHVILTANLEE